MGNASGCTVCGRALTAQEAMYYGARCEACERASVTPVVHWVDGIAEAALICHQASVDGGWWHDLDTGERLERNRAEMLCLIHSEISEAMEGERKGLMDDKLPHRPMAEVELADAVIRILDYAGGHGYDVAGAMAEKLEFNRQRADHKPENRTQDGGKRF